MLFKKLAVMSFLSVAFVGCGFQPLMTGNPKTPQTFMLKINGSGYSGYKFRRELEKQLALTPKVNDKAYALTVSISEAYIPLSYGMDATISRNQIQATALYTILDGAQTVATGKVTAYSSYILNYTEEFSTRSAQAAASERTLISLAEELSREVMLRIRSVLEKEEKTHPLDPSEKDDLW